MPFLSTDSAAPTTSRTSQRLTFVQTVDIARPPAKVFRYVTDFAAAHEWRSEVVESSADPAGPMALGTRLHEVAVVAGRRVVTDSVVDGFEPGSRFTFAHVAGPLPVSGEYRCDPIAGGTRLTYTLNVELTGAWALGAPLLRLTGRRTLARSLATLRLGLELGR